MKIYLVGGAVRDKLLGLPVKEQDYVVVGATVADMLRLGYQQVGKEFPVFLHPKTRDEYALARMERKTNPGYTGFSFDTSPSVTLEEDLLRRDLTINAMAETDEGEIIDPYGGKEDLKKKLLRHVSPAFCEDPVRILRIGRFFARYQYLGFTIAPETITLMQTMVQSGEVDALVAERVWKELERALGEKNPEAFFTALDRCGALAILFPDVGKNDLHALINAAALTEKPIVRFAALLSALPEKPVKILCDRYRIPNAYRELAVLSVRYSMSALRANSLAADELLGLFHALDIFRREERFQDFLSVCQAIAHTKKQVFPQDWLLGCAQAVKAYDVQELIKQGLTDQALAAALKEKRREKIAEWIKNNP